MPKGVRIWVWCVWRRVVFFQKVEAEIRDFEHKSRVDDAVGRFKFAVCAYFTGVQKRHALESRQVAKANQSLRQAAESVICYFDGVVHQAVSEDPVEFYSLVLEDVLKAASRTVLGQDAAVRRIDASADEPHQVRMVNVFHLKLDLHSCSLLRTDESFNKSPKLECGLLTTTRS